MVNDPMQTNSSSIQWGQVTTIGVMLLFAIVIGGALLAGSIGSGQGYLWLGVCCIFPIFWYCGGYLQTKDKTQSSALLMSVIGWVLVAMGFIVHYKAVLEVDPGTPITQVSFSQLTILLVLGLLVLIIGGLLSWQTISNSQSQETDLTQ